MIYPDHQSFPSSLFFCLTINDDHDSPTLRLHCVTSDIFLPLLFSVMHHFCAAGCRLFQSLPCPFNTHLCSVFVFLRLFYGLLYIPYTMYLIAVVEQAMATTLSLLYNHPTTPRFVC